jgi:hypothetical protein
MITFEYPGYNPTESITLGSPERDDDQVELDEVFIHTTESGQHKTNVSISCVGEFERHLSFTAICHEEKEKFLDFVVQAHGHYVKYTDYDNRAWMTQITDEVINVSKSPYGYDIDLNLLVWELT